MLSSSTGLTEPTPGFRGLMMILVFLIILPFSCTAGTISKEPAEPAFPDGGMLFSGQRNNQWDLYVWRPGPDGGTVYPLTQTPRPEGNPIYWARHALFLCSIERGKKQVK
ncbi:MAG: hypothetical protein HQM09_07745 [Candidatus Riflebacteria bacterium]|nr:hypothetical protein [Candidatus Riflebacteria bacterium]